MDDLIIRIGATLITINLIWVWCKIAHKSREWYNGESAKDLKAQNTQLGNDILHLNTKVKNLEKELCGAKRQGGDVKERVEAVLSPIFESICTKYNVSNSDIKGLIPNDIYERLLIHQSMLRLRVQEARLGEIITNLEIGKSEIEDDIKRLNLKREKQVEQSWNLTCEIANKQQTAARIEEAIADLADRYTAKMEYYEEFPEWTIPETIKNVASMYADIESNDAKLVERYLREKNRPAIKAADEISKIRKEKREAIRKLKEMQYEYDWLLQQLPDYADSTQDVIEEIEAIAAEVDEVELWLSKEEWQNLSPIEKNQLALDRYNQRNKKSNRRIGYDYELYCGHYIYKGELLGGRGIDKIIQYGIENGLEDRGRDIIAEGNGMVYVIQCKCWRKVRPIRENTIMQLYGSAAEYCFSQYGSESNPLKRLHKTVVPVLITTTTLSEVAARFAKYLGIEVVQFAFDKPYPQIKCNIGRDGEKIYHLPFDQQYDTTIIERHRGECFVSTVQEAEDLGFRHAMRHTITQG